MSVQYLWYPIMRSTLVRACLPAASVTKKKSFATLIAVDNAISSTLTLDTASK
jgi:hypothetical protein